MFLCDYTAFSKITNMLPQLRIYIYSMSSTSGIHHNLQLYNYKVCCGVHEVNSDILLKCIDTTVHYSTLHHCTCVTLWTKQSSAYVPLCVHGRRSNLGSLAILPKQNKQIYVMKKTYYYYEEEQIQAPCTILY